MTKWLAPFRRLSGQRRNDLFWILLLMSMIPALREDLLFPTAWVSSLSSQFALPTVSNPFWLAALALAWIVAGVAYVSGERLRALASVPYLALLFADGFRSVAALLYPALPLADSWLGDAFGFSIAVYTVSAFGAFVYFVLRGEALSLPFVVFTAILIAWQQFDGLLAWPQILVFLVAILVFRLVIEAVEQNLPLARDLGRSNLLSLAGRTFALWWPMLILIAIGLWGSARITSATEELMYERGYVTAYCSLDVSDPLSALPCPEGDPVLLPGQFSRVFEGEGMPDDAPRICQLSRPRVDSLEPLPPPPRFRCPSGEAESWALMPLGFFDSLDMTVVKRYDLLEDKLKRSLNRIDMAALAAGDEAVTTARELFSIVPQSTGLNTRSCTEFPFVDCEAANIVIRGLNKAYKARRAEAEQDFIRYARRQATDLETDLGVRTDNIRGRLARDLSQAKAATRRSIDRVHSASNIVRQVLLLWLIVVAIKSVLYVFARVIFDKSTDIDIDLLEHEGTPAEGRVSTRQEITIPGDYAHDIYYKANYQPLGPAARFSIPQWRASFMSRLRFGAWNMSRVIMPMDDNEGITFNSVEAEHLVDWELEEGEEVVFSYRNFVAMNDNIQLRTIISLRVATLLLGRIVFHTARCTGGPGRLILRTRGQPATDAQVRRSIPAARLIAWNRYARFSVDSHLTLADIFLNGFNLRRSAVDDTEGPQGILIVEADARDGGLLVGTLRFARNFLLPV